MRSALDYHGQERTDRVRDVYDCVWVGVKWGMNKSGKRLERMFGLLNRRQSEVPA